MLLGDASQTGVEEELRRPSDGGTDWILCTDWDRHDAAADRRKNGDNEEKAGAED